MSRVLALVGAILLIVLAVLVRAAIDDDGGSDGGDDDGDELVVHCIPELEDACRAIDRPMQLTIADPQATIDAVAAGEDVDAWVTLDPWPEMASIIDSRARLDGPTEAVAESELVVVARGDDVPPDCPDPFTWACLVEGLDDLVAAPDGDSALGRLVLGQAGNDIHPGFAGNELDSDDALRSALDTIDNSIDDPAGEMLLFPDPDAAGTTEAYRATEIAPSPRSDGFVLSPSAAPAAVAVVVVGPRADRIAGEPSFTDALEDLGWRLSPDAATIGLPSPGVLVALGDFVG